MTKTKRIIRYTIAAFMLIMVFIETGIFTSITLALVFIRFEINEDYFTRNE